MSDDAIFSAAHCRAARGLLDWTQEQVAKRADVSRMTVKRFEKGESLRRAQENAIRLAFEDAGVVFLGRSEASGVALLTGVGLKPGHFDGEPRPGGDDGGESDPDAA